MSNETTTGRHGGWLNLATAVTLTRGGFYVLVAGFVFVPVDTRFAWVPALCYGTGALFNKLDGSLARTVSQETQLGERLDTAFDILGFVAAPLVAVAWGLLPAWYLSLSIAPFLYHGGRVFRRLCCRQVFVRPGNDLGRYLAGGQMVFLTVVLLPLTPDSVGFTLAPVILAPSLAVFLRDYLYMSGRLPRTWPSATELTRDLIE